MALKVSLAMCHLLAGLISIQWVMSSNPDGDLQRRSEILSNILADSVNRESGRMHRAPGNIDAADRDTAVMQHRAEGNKDAVRNPGQFDLLDSEKLNGADQFGSSNLEVEMNERINRDKLDRLMAALAFVLNNRRTRQMAHRNPDNYNSYKLAQRSKHADTDIEMVRRSFGDIDHTISSVLPPWTEICRMLRRRDCGRFVRRR